MLFTLSILNFFLITTSIYTNIYTFNNVNEGRTNLYILLINGLYIYFFVILPIIYKIKKR